MDDPRERRQFGRLHLLAYGQGKVCTLELGGTHCRADLIDISSGGARLKHSPPPELPDKKELVFSVSDTDDNGRLQKLSATIRWRNGLEFGIKFDEELDLAVSALQKMVC